MNRIYLLGLLSLSSLAALGAVSSGCATEGYCFRDCGDKVNTDGGSPETGTGGHAGGEGGIDFDQNVPDQIIITDAKPDNPETCVITNDGIELCDELDNDCNGVIDDAKSADGGLIYDKHGILHCGTCTNNCVSKLFQVDPASITCNWDGVQGHEGKCEWTACAADYWNIDGNKDNGCEYYCTKTADTDTTCNQLDDNCNGQKDEQVDKCTSTTDCGKCGGTCVAVNATVKCVAGPLCNATDTHCAINACNAGFYDLDNSYATGCEYACTPTTNPQEVCGDGVDNDCNGKIDAADTVNIVGDPQLNQDCYGDPDGECATAAHVGKTVCVGQKVECQGPNVIVAGQIKETCNGLDDDCDGIPDNNLTDVGTACGNSAVFPCQLGAMQCIGGSLKCVGDVGPGNETCNGFDDDCDGTIDNNLTDISGTCGQSAVGECKLGAKVCQGGVIICQGNINPKFESCNGKDDDCDGTADNNLTDTGASCGSSGISPCKLGTVQCDNGTLKCLGKLDPGTESCNGIDDDCDGVVDNNTPGSGVSCGTNSTFPCKKGAMQCVSGSMVCVGAVEPKTEVCNLVDDNCDGLIDNAPTDTGAVCGLSSTAPCHKGTVGCVNGVLTCQGNLDPVPETCNGIDDDCNGTKDDNVNGIGADCGTSNILPCKYGKTVCTNGTISCSGAVNPTAEQCDGIDNNCNGTIDDGAQGTGVGCGQSNQFPCAYGSTQCVSGAIQCVGATNPGTETCNGIDDNCDGTIDKTGSNPPADSVGACDVPTPPPTGVTSPCKAGTKACVGGVVVCQGSVKPVAGATDKCGEDTNCDGQLTNQPDKQTDPYNCGTCGHDCTSGAHHANWGCQAGACVFLGCQTGWYDNGGPGDAAAGDHLCDYPCTYISSQEACNGTDDNCNGTTDENVIAPSPVQVCGVSPGATATECKAGAGGVSVACVSGAFKCTFPAGVCNPTCATATEICDGLDNDCDGVTNENVSNYGKPCASDDGKPAPGDGACRTTGTYVCNGANATACSATKDLSKAGPETCDGVDNDCDGLIDETFKNKGTNMGYFVQPVVTRIASAVWMYSYEASRPNATTSSPGVGNGYFTSAPSGVTMDKTVSCSVQGVVPWFNVTGNEVEQNCTAMGGRACTTAEWQTGCGVTPYHNCTWGYAPADASCTTVASSTKFCNLGPFDQLSADFLLVTGHAALQYCYADWSGHLSNPTTSDKLWDITGNLREITKSATNQYKLMGGAFNSESEAGAACSFNFYTVDQNFQFFDTGFRCCFDQDPRL